MNLIWILVNIVAVNAFILSQDNIISDGLYFGVDYNLNNTELIASDVLQLPKNFTLYIDIDLINFTQPIITTHQDFKIINLFTYGNQTHNINLYLYVLPSGTQMLLILALYEYISPNYLYKIDQTITYNTQPSFINHQIIVQYINGNINIMMDNIFKISNIPVDFNIPNSRISIKNGALDIFPCKDFIMNKFTVYNTSMDISAGLLEYVFPKENVWLDYNFKIPNFYILNSNIKTVKTDILTDLQFLETSVFDKYNFGVVPIVFSVRYLSGIKVNLIINNYIYQCESNHTETDQYNFVNLYNCPIDLQTVGAFDIYITFNAFDQPKYHKLTQKFTVLEYSSRGFSNVQNTPIDLNLGDSNMVFNLGMIGLGISLMIAGLLVFLIKYTKSEKISERLVKLDLLYIVQKDKKIIDIRSDSRNKYLGMGSTFYIRSTQIGGIITIILIIVAVFTAIGYLYDSLNNNTIINQYLLNSNGNTVDLETSHIKITVTFKDLLYGKCNIDNTTQCVPEWNVYSNNLDIGKEVKCKNFRIDNFRSNCQIEWSCQNCQTQIGGLDSLITFQTLQHGITFLGFDYIIRINGYNAIDNIISGTVNIENTIFLGLPLPTISLITNPAVYISNQNKKTGFTLDYQTTDLTGIINLSNYTNTKGISDIIQFTNGEYIMDSNTLSKNLIGLNVKLTRSPNWIFIQETQKYSIYIIVFQGASIIISIFGLSKIILNLITKKRILKLLLCKTIKKTSDVELATKV